MYLSKLNVEQKELFLDLCIHGANSNNDFADDEKAMIKAYCQEMMIPERYEEIENFEECTDKLIKISTEEEIREIFVELSALILSDDIVDTYEDEFMQRFIEKAGISNAEYKQVISILKKISALYSDLNEFVTQE